MEQNIELRQSFSTQQPLKHAAPPGGCCKSEITFVRHKQLARNLLTINSLNETLVEYYKKYDHDEVPVKDSSCHSTTLTEAEDRSITNSELDKLETNIFKNISQVLQANNNSSLTSMESNLKFFKTTVQEIFDNFYASMRDFELYKKRFHEILAKNEEEAVANMENFIKDVIHHIMSSESSLTNESDWSREQSDTSKKSEDLSSSDMKEGDVYVGNAAYVNNPEHDSNSTSVTSSIQPVIEAYTNEDYLTDTSMGDTKTSKATSCKEEVFNIFLLGANPYVQIKMNERNRLSEINIKEPSNIGDGKYVASAENMQRLADKKMELKKYVERDQSNCDGSDREIPVKVSYAKKNIYLNEDFSQEHYCEKSFMSRLCSYLCRRFRKY